jgi:replicative DNA helicase
MPSADSSLQENVLTLLCFSKEHVNSVANIVSVDLFDNEIYREIAEKAITYFKKFKKPIANHLPDVFEKQLNKEKNRKRAETFEIVLKGLRSIKNDINTEFVLQELHKFVHSQGLRLTLKRAVELYQEGKLDQIDKLLDERKKRVVDMFDPGLLFIKDMDRTLAFLYQHEELFCTGVDQLDDMGIVPARKELFTRVGASGTGKSWAMTHIGKSNVMTRETVVHVSLEMSEQRCAQRYVQAMLAIAKNKRDIKTINLTGDEHGKINELELDRLTNIWSLKDDKIDTLIRKKLNKLRKPRLIIKQFPTGQLTIDTLVAYLENLRIYAKVFPDILIIDYADLMNIDTKNLRIDTGRIYKDLRGLAMQYNMAVVTASQSNRSGEDVTTITRKHIAEDFSKIAISDNVIIYNQTKEEKLLGLAREYIDKARNERSGDSILITQNYNIGQYCLQSAVLKGDYWEKLNDTFPDIMRGNMLKKLSSGRRKLSRKINSEENNDE